MKAAVLRTPYDIRIEDVEDPKIGPEDVLLENIHTGICGSDINRYKGFRGSGEAVFPAILGHEISGTIAQVGQKVKGFRIGDRVYGTKQGSLSRYFVVPQAKLFNLPDDVSLEQAQSLGPIGCVLHAINLGAIKIGEKVAILGPGHAGLILVQWARMAGADQVIVTGTRDNRLHVAKDLGAAFTVNITREDPVKRVKDITNGLGVDIVIEATGRPDAVNQAIGMIKAGGRIVIFGVGQEPVDNFDIYSVYRNQITMIGCRGRTESETDAALKCLGCGKVSVEAIITHVLPLEETNRAFEIVDKRLDNAIRVVIKS